MSEIFYTNPKGKKIREVKEFANAIEVKLYISELLLSDCTDIFVKTACVVYDYNGKQIDYIFNDADYS